MYFANLPTLSQAGEKRWRRHLARRATERSSASRLLTAGPSAAGLADARSVEQGAAAGSWRRGLCDPRAASAAPLPPVEPSSSSTAPAAGLGRSSRPASRELRHAQDRLTPPWSTIGEWCGGGRRPFKAACRDRPRGGGAPGGPRHPAHHAPRHPAPPRAASAPCLASRAPPAEEAAPEVADEPRQLQHPARSIQAARPGSALEAAPKVAALARQLQHPARSGEAARPGSAPVAPSPPKAQPARAAARPAARAGRPPAQLAPRPPSVRGPGGGAASDSAAAVAASSAAADGAGAVVDSAGAATQGAAAPALQAGAEGSASAGGRRGPSPDAALAPRSSHADAAAAAPSGGPRPPRPPPGAASEPCGAGVPADEHPPLLTSPESLEGDAPLSPNWVRAQGVRAVAVLSPQSGASPSPGSRRRRSASRSGQGSPKSARSSGSEPFGDEAGDEHDGPCFTEPLQDDEDPLGLPQSPVEARLPPWLPGELGQPLLADAPAGPAAGGAAAPARPEVRCTGPGQVVISWEVPPSTSPRATWCLRVRQKGEPESWRPIDLDAGLVVSGSGEAGWKGRGSLPNDGLKVLSYCVDEGKKSSEPYVGTLMCHYPGVAVIGFDFAFAAPGREVQRVPQDWVLHAVPAKADTGDLFWDVFNTHRFRSAKRTNWNRARSKVGEMQRVIDRQSVVIWGRRPDVPEPGSRVAAACTLGRHPANEADASAQGELGHAEASAAWWPALVRSDFSEGSRSAGDPAGEHAPEDLLSLASVRVAVEPWPRVQVVPVGWLCEETQESQMAAKNLCVGQEVLAYYVHGDFPEASVQHPQPQEPGDVTYVLGEANQPKPPLLPADDAQATAGGLVQRRRSSLGQALAPPEPPAPARRPEPPRSERAVRGEVLRPLVSPEKVMLDVRAKGHSKDTLVPLTWVHHVIPGAEPPVPPGRRASTGAGGRGRKRISEWRIVCPGMGSAARVVAHQGPLDGPCNEQVQLLRGTKVAFYSAVEGRVSLYIGFVQRVRMQVSHVEVRFTGVAPEDAEISPHSLGSALSPGRWRPAVVVHDLPEDLGDVEVAVGVLQEPELCGAAVWSSPSEPCRVQERAQRLMPPLTPVMLPDGLSRAVLRWIVPSEPAAVCSRVRWREAGIPDWFYLDPSGMMRGSETDAAHKSRLVPLAPGAWASAYVQQDGRRTPAPVPVRIVQVDEDVDQITVRLQGHTAGPLHVAEPARRPGEGAGPAGRGEPEGGEHRGGSQQRGQEQVVPGSWVDAVWAADGPHLLRGAPLFAFGPAQPAVLGPAGDGGYLVHLGDGDSEEPEEAEEFWLPGVRAPEEWAEELEVGPEGAVGDVQVGSIVVHGLRAERQYQAQVQVLTGKGWSPWSSVGSLQMPRVGYEQEELASEENTNAYYSANLLPFALFKEYGKCWETIEESLPPERFYRLEALARKTGKPESFSVEASLKLIDSDGPIRQSSKLPESEARAIIRKAVEVERANVNFRDQATGRSPLTYACEYGRQVQPGIVEELLLLRADVDSSNDARETALALAAARGHDRIVEILLAHGANTNVVDLCGETALLGAKVLRYMSPVERAGIERCRSLLRASRAPFSEFEARLAAAADPVEAASSFLSIAFPGGGVEAMWAEDKGEKRISKHDRLRLREQIMESSRSGECKDEAERRGRFCAAQLLAQLRAASLQDPPNRVCAPFSRYLLHSGVMRWCQAEAHEVATELLAHFETDLRRQRDELRALRTLTRECEKFAGIMAKQNRPTFSGRALHQWHAHDSLPWLTEHNVVGAYEALLRSGAITGLEDFCGWVGELNARIASSDGENVAVRPGAWDNRLPHLFWGNVYMKFLIGEASRCAPLFHKIAQKLADSIVGGTAQYKEAPNKSSTRVTTKQVEYASLGLAILHEALDRTPGRFRLVLRADLPQSGFKDVSDADLPAGAAATRSPTRASVSRRLSKTLVPPAVLVVGAASPAERWRDTLEAARHCVREAEAAAAAPGSRRPSVGVPGAATPGSGGGAAPKAASPAAAQPGGHGRRLSASLSVTEATARLLEAPARHGTKRKTWQGGAPPPPRPVSRQQSTRARQAAVVVFLRAGREDEQSAVEEAEQTLRANGVDAVVVHRGSTITPNEARDKLDLVYREAQEKRGLRVLPRPQLDPRKVQLLFETRKCRTGDMDDLLCCGGCLDLVRGSITCTTEEEVQQLFSNALRLTIEHDNAEVVRIKNGFHTPAIGGYCDLKLFLLIVADTRQPRGRSRSSDSLAGQPPSRPGRPDEGADNVASNVCHICELQVHLKDFLECKKYTHMPYCIDRGDFDEK